MAVSLEKKPFIREYTPTHLIDEEESMPKRDSQGSCSLEKESVSKLDNQDSLMIEEEIGEHSEQPQSKRERFAEKIWDIWDDITCFFCDGIRPIIVVFVLSIFAAILLVLHPRRN